MYILCRSLVGAGLSQFKSDTIGFKLPFFDRFRNSEDRYGIEYDVTMIKL